MLSIDKQHHYLLNPYMHKLYKDIYANFIIALYKSNNIYVTYLYLQSTLIALITHLLKFMHQVSYHNLLLMIHYHHRIALGLVM